MSGWQRVRVARDGGRKVVVTETVDHDPTETVEETAERAQPSRPGNGPERPRQPRAPRRVQPRPTALLCEACAGAGTVEVVTGASWTSTTPVTGPGHPAGTSRVDTRPSVCAPCRGLGWVLVSPRFGPVAPLTPLVTVPQRWQPWWAPLTGQGPQITC